MYRCAYLVQTKQTTKQCVIIRTEKKTTHTLLRKQHSMGLSLTGLRLRDTQSAAWWCFPALYLNTILNSWRARAHLIRFALFGDDSDKYVNGLWSLYNLVTEPNNQFRYFRNARIQAYAYFSIVAQLACVRVNLLLANATGCSLPA
jgi:hypothetical protein